MPFVERFQQIRNFVMNVCLVEAIQFVQDLTHAICLDFQGLFNLK
ncbi:uncharacterized protein LOC108163690 [Drosophila miranda]|uniref:Uncharacterized protein n=1 Tax=Drosophila pseudoobscura pseudoobscura TaxID=46245 RepID=A0A6I8V9T3_DROPS|nr:uncharacterized protein LOC26532508 [Drosophila pseudoobscura]XP_017154610.1 uncharacterized protein LOC108163690 [Drosophila miranda]XP_022218964.1 uncharacterized protein LOC111071764 [Drosophila obscura]XP_026843637.1 uncharacterized protein LOC113565538 [Drosophila persimilis]XP_034128949.1 uncharacterized protein LOC117584254 [Drosophila guanche]XP_034666265.1 uncharacterized protein LOC117900142 [Drosophila subobscura]